MEINGLGCSAGRRCKVCTGTLTRLDVINIQYRTLGTLEIYAMSSGRCRTIIVPQPATIATTKKGPSSRVFIRRNVVFHGIWLSGGQHKIVVLLPNACVQHADRSQQPHLLREG